MAHQVDYNKKVLFLSATEKGAYFKNAECPSIKEMEAEFAKDKVKTHTASYPIEVNLIEENLEIDENPKLTTIYFFNSVITAHELAGQLRNKGVNFTEWTGIQKTSGDISKLIIATSAAEVGLDLELYEMHTQFWGFDWEISSLIQRIGRVGRFKSEHPFNAFIHVGDTQEPYLIKKIFEENETLSKDQFTELLYNAYGEQPFEPTEYVSYYLWSKEEKQKLKYIWQIIDSKISFYFRPPQSQAVFEWNGHKFVYNKHSIENQYHIELERRVTDMPFWKSFGLSEYKILSKKSHDERSWNKPYTGKLRPVHNSKKWFIYQPEESNII